MELTHLNQIDFRELRLEKIDCMIATTGTQTRCFHLARELHNSVTKKILLVLENENPKINKYLSVFDECGFGKYPISNNPQTIDHILNEIGNIRAHQVNILVDYSCMPKKWYALLVDSITRNNYQANRINLFLSYTPKVFERNKGRHAIDYIGPIVFNRDNLKDKKPVSMIAALDNNQNSVLEAVSKVKPQKLLAFIPHCTHDPEYTQLVIDNNKTLLEKLDRNSIINYDADRPEEINTLLTSYCLDERVASEVMILPQGPKTFSMMSLLLSIRYPDVKLWEIIHREQKQNVEHGQPAANPIIVKASFINDDDLNDE